MLYYLPMVNLDDTVSLEQKDTGKIVSSIRLLPDQMELAWEAVMATDIPQSYHDCGNVVMCGMGGSTLGGRIVDSLLIDRVRMPIETMNGYNLPYYVDKNSFVFVSSYSGNTEEAVSMLEEAIEKKAKIFGVASGGKLLEIFEREGIPHYKIDTKANPSGQPRMGLGYSVAATLAVLSKSGYIHMSSDEFYELVVVTREFVKEFDIDIPTNKNLAKKMAEKFKDRGIILIASNHLVGVAHAFKNQLNESSKTFSALFDLPELNHHLLEGLKFPKKGHGVFHFFFVESDLYSKRVQIRYDLTKEIVDKKYGHEFSTYHPRTEKKISQIFETLTLGSFVSYYLALLNDVDPTAIPFVDYFKEQLAKK